MTIVVSPDIVLTLSFTAFCQINGIYSDRKRLHEFVKSCVEDYNHEVGLTEDRWLEVWMDYNRWGRQAMIAAQDAQSERETLAYALV